MLSFFGYFGIKIIFKVFIYRKKYELIKKIIKKIMYLIFLPLLYTFFLNNLLIYRIGNVINQFFYL